MTARVQIVVEAKDAASGIFRGIARQFGALGGVFEELTSKNTAWGNVAAEAASLVVQGMKDSVKATQEYAKEVRDLSLASGASAEEASRMLQVLDDYQLTAEDAKTATRALTREGFAPTVETIAQLSEQYLQLNTAQERNAFVQKNLGRAGQEWLNLLNQGPEKIRAMNEAVASSLILTEKDIAATEEYRLALDQWNDTAQATKITVGTALIPALSDILKIVDADVQAITGFRDVMQEAREEVDKTAGLADKFAKFHEVTSTWAADIVNSTLPSFMRDTATATEDAATATENLNQTEIEFSTTLDSTAQYYRNYVHSIESSIPTLEEVKAQATAISDTNKQFIGVLGEVGSALDTYNSGIAEANAALAEGNIKADEHAARVAELAAEYENASNRIALSIVEMKLATDGWTRAELAAYLKVGQQLDIFTTEQIKATEAALDMADAALAGVEPILHVGERAEDAADGFGVMEESAGALGDTINKTALPAVAGLKSAINGLPPTGTSWSYDFFINVNGRVPQLATATYSTGAGYNTTVHPGGGGRQTGGQVYAGNPYMVGEGGAEPFVPSQSGRILGHAESLHALTLAGGRGGNSTNVFYGTVYISPDAQAGGDIMSIR
jgi:hypothetical protein